MGPISIRLATMADADDLAMVQLLRSAVTSRGLGAVVAAAITTGVCLVAHGDGALVGCICVSNGVPHGWTVSAIAVAEDHRRRGIGRQLVTDAMERLGSQSLNAETDRDAVDFYRHLGFAVSSLGEKYPGVERFACHLEGGRRGAQATSG